MDAPMIHDGLPIMTLSTRDNQSITFPSAEVTVVSQIAEEIFGRNFMYYFIQGTTALILILAANTGYSIGPALKKLITGLISRRKVLFM